MNGLLLACNFLPLLGVLLVWLASEKNEKRIAAISLFVAVAMGAAIVGLLGAWAYHGFEAYEFRWFTLYEKDDYHFTVAFYLDKIGATYLFTIGVIFSVIVRYCRYYLHREAGYKRFFLTIFALAFGLNTVVLSDSIDQLFAGWEFVGISSFLLVAFYRHRPQPIRNSLRAYSVYRFCDLGLFLGGWMVHLLFHDKGLFAQFSALAPEETAGPLVFLLSLLILIAATGKSAQFPFCFWLPRAMEGPTPSSAIFYGALSIHLGVFLLLRTAPIWSAHVVSRAMIFIIGALTVVTAGISEKAQSNIKGQIAYASITQVGLMFIELALGWEILIVPHLMGNAFLRCYQLLVSPSIIAHLLRIEGSVDSDFQVQSKSIYAFMPMFRLGGFSEKLRNSLYVFALQECNLERAVRWLLWDWLKKISAAVNTVTFGFRLFIAGFIAAWAAMAYGILASEQMFYPAALGMVLASLSAFSQKHGAYKTWNAIALSCVFAGLAIGFLRRENIAVRDALWYLSGITVSWPLGLLALKRLLEGENFAEKPYLYRAKSETKPALSWFLFMSFLGLSSFPITTTFVGDDLLLYFTGKQHFWFAISFGFAYVLNGIAAATLFQRLCMGRPEEIAADSGECDATAK